MRDGLPNETDTWNRTTIVHAVVQLNSIRICCDFHLYQQLLHAVIEYGC